MENEELLVGQVLNRPGLLHELDLKPTDFIGARCRKVFETICNLTDRNQAVDLVTVAVELPAMDKGWLASLTTESTWNVQRLRDAVVEESRSHKLRVLALEVAERLDNEPASLVLDHFEQHLAEISESRGDDVRLLKDELKRKIDEFEQRYKNRGEIPGIASGIDDLDQVTLGWQPSRLIVVGARPSEGKSALILNFVLEAAKKGLPVGVLSLESSRDEFLERAFSNLSGISGYALRTGNLTPSNFNDMMVGAEDLDKLPIWVADNPNMQLAELKSKARKMVRANGCKLLAIDYVQLIQTGKSQSDYERVSEVSIAVKNLSRELNVPIIVAAQLHRPNSESKSRKPRLSDFKNSGQIEQDADTAILIHNIEDAVGDKTILCVEKNRDGVKADVPVYFDKARMRFRRLAT